MDVISIDFYQRLPFRMKAPMVKAAIEVQFTANKEILVLRLYVKLFLCT